MGENIKHNNIDDFSNLMKKLINIENVGDMKKTLEELRDN